MEPADLIRTITETFGPELEVFEVDGNAFFYYGAERQQLPLCTLITNDLYDTASNLSRPGVYRLNVGMRKSEFVARFGAPPEPPGESGIIATGHDFTALDILMPHPIYASYCWVCVLNPSAPTLAEVMRHLSEAFERAKKRKTPHRTRRV